MKKIITTTILVLSIIVTVNAQSNDVLAKSYFLKAQEAYSNGENTTALKQLGKTVEYLGATNAKIEALYVKISLNNNNYLEANKHLKNYFKNANEDHSDYNDMVSLAVEVKEKAEIEKEKERQRVLTEKKIIREAIKEKRPIPINIVESPPIYPGCEGGRDILKDCFDKKIRKFFTKKIDFDLFYDLGMPSGKKKLSLEFNINSMGEISEIKPKSPHPKITRELVRVTNLLPKMKPAKQSGEAVSVRYTLNLTLNII